MPRVLKGILVGLLLGSVCAAPDGLVLGLFFGHIGDWLISVTAVGAGLGALIGGFAAALGPSLILRPPEINENRANDSAG